MGEGDGRRCGQTQAKPLDGLEGRRKPAAIVGFAAAAGLAMCVHSSSPKTPPSDSLAPYAALVAELDLRRRVNVLHPNPQSIFDGLHVGHVNVGAGNLTFRRRDIVARADGPVVFARVYDSRIEANADLGPGWRLSLAEELRLEGDQAIYTDRSGAQHRFRKDGDAHVADPPTPRHAGTTLTVAEKKAVLLERDGAKRVFLRASETAPFLLRRVVSAGGRKLLFAHEDGLLRSVSHDGAMVFEIRRRADGRVREVADAHGRFVEYSYTVDGRLKDVYDIAGNLWWHEYDEDGRLAEALGANRRPYLRVRYDAAGRVARTRAGRLHRYAYDGARTTVTEGGGLRHVFERNALGATKRYTSDSGAWWKIGFDAAGRVAEFDAPGRTLRYRYGTDGDVVAMEEWTANDRRERRFTRDAGGRLTGAEDDDGAWVLVEYLGDHVSVHGPEADEEFATAGGRVEEAWDGGAFVHAERDAAGGVTALRRAGRAVYFTRDHLGRIVDTTYADGSTSRYFHDALGNRERVEHGNGASVRYGHDPAGNIVRVEVTEADGASKVQTTRVGDMNQVERVEYEGSAAIDVAYDDMGRPVRFESAADTVTARYDAFGALAELASEKTDAVWRPPAGDKAPGQYEDPRRTVLGGDPLGAAQPEHGVLDFGGGASTPAPRDLLAAGVPGLADARALLAAARPLFEDDAAAGFEKPSNPVFQPPEYRSTNCCIPCFAIVCWDCYLGGSMDTCYCNPSIDVGGIGGGGGGGGAPAYAAPAQITVDHVPVNKRHRPGGTQEKRELGVTNHHYSASGSKCVAVTAGGTDRRFEGIATIGNMNIEVFTRVHCPGNLLNRWGKRKSENISRTIAHERQHAAAVIAVLNRFNDPAAPATNDSGMPKVGQVFSTLAACQAAALIWQNALADAHGAEVARQTAHCDHLGQNRVRVQCRGERRADETVDGPVYADPDGVCR